MPNKLLPSRMLIQRMPACLEAIRRHFCDYGTSPSFAELANRIGVQRHQIRPMVVRLSASGLIGWTPGRARSITLPRPLSRYANSDLLWELQARGLPISIGRQGDMPHAIASAWPEALVVDLAQLPKDELDLLDRIDEVFAERTAISPAPGDPQHGEGAA